MGICSSSKPLLLKLKEVSTIRKDIDSHSISYKNIIKHYSEINSSLLDIIIKIAKKSHIPKITNNIISYSHLLYLRENIGLQRAEGIVVLSNKFIDKT